MSYAKDTVWQNHALVKMYNENVIYHSLVDTVLNIYNELETRLVEKGFEGLCPRYQKADLLMMEISMILTLCDRLELSLEYTLCNRRDEQYLYGIGKRRLYGGEEMFKSMLNSLYSKI